VVGTRHVGSIVLLQGGVALNRAVAPAMAALSGRTILVPQHPELMGCFGAALMARDLMDEGKIVEHLVAFDQLKGQRVTTKGIFKCGSCQNRCDVQRILIGEKTYSFGGLCSRWEMQRRPASLRFSEGKDLVSLRTKLMFERFIPSPPKNPLARIGLPLALTTYELYPFYAKLLVEMGFEVVLSRPGKGCKNTHAPFCYPAELLHAAVDDLLAQDVDWIFLPQVREFAIPGNLKHAYTCSFTQDSAGVIRNLFPNQAEKILAPELGLSAHLLESNLKEVKQLAEQLGVHVEQANTAFKTALEYQDRFWQTYHLEGQAVLQSLNGPVVILVGRPYAAYNDTVNLSLPRKIASRGFHVIPSDLLALEPPSAAGNVWHFTQQSAAAIQYARDHTDSYLCVLSCFSCNPDAIIYHRMRHEMEGQPFCFLEIDSHTADAGIDTRIGAFLDIIEERGQLGKAQASDIISSNHDSRIDTSGKNPAIVCDGERIGFNDPRVMHVLLADTPKITSRLFKSLYRWMGWRCVVTPYMDAKVLQAARRVCSGRECLPFLAMVGKMVLYLENRDPEEITLFHILEQDGPCQIGNWFDAVHMIFQRMMVSNVFPVWPRINNNYLGGGETAAVAVAAGGVLGDLMGEVRSALTCLAENPPGALAALDEMEDRLVQAGEHGLLAVERELRRITRDLKHIPLRGKLEDHPKVLLYSGINRIFVDKPVRDFFERRGIMAKTGDIGEFLCFYETEPVVRRGFALGKRTPDEHFGWGTLLKGLFNNPTWQPRFQAARAGMHVWAIEMLDHHWRRLMVPSGLIFAPDFHYRKLLTSGHEKVSLNGWTEAPCTAGRYLASMEEGSFDGYVNIGAFNCTPASSATAVTHRAAVSSNLPYAVIESDGAAITASQLRQLEAVAAQCWEQKGKARPG
jgi:predicted nucleotide-binding protein (sugar kinase/HSP70/actin superfamily)